MKPFYEKKDRALQSFESMNLEFPEHLHDHIEILYVLKGSIVVQIMEKRQRLEEGDCAVIFPQQIHSYHAPEDSLTRLFLFEDSLTGMYLRSIRTSRPSCPFLSAGDLTEDGVLALERLYSLSCNDRKEQAEVPQARAATESQTAGEMAAAAKAGTVRERISAAEAMTAARDNDSINKTALCSAWIQVLLALVWPQLTVVRREQSESIEFTCQLVQYIMEHFQEPLTLESLARELHVNKYYISNLFSSRLQTNFRRYLNHVRLEYAMQLINTSDAPLIDVWAEAGFNSQRSFNRAFVEIMGVTPMEYRKSAGS